MSDLVRFSLSLYIARCLLEALVFLLLIAIIIITHFFPFPPSVTQKNGLTLCKRLSNFLQESQENLVLSRPSSNPFLVGSWACLSPDAQRRGMEERLSG